MKSDNNFEEICAAVFTSGTTELDGLRGVLSTPGPRTKINAYM